MKKLTLKRRGYTVVEAVAASIVVGGLTLFALGIWAAVHFIAKYW